MHRRFTDWRTHTPRFGMVTTLLAALFLANFSSTTVGATSSSVAVTTVTDTITGCATTGIGPCSLRDAIHLRQYV